MTSISDRYRFSCKHDPETWEWRQVRGHDPRTGFVHYYREVHCLICEERRNQLRELKFKKRKNLS